MTDAPITRERVTKTIEIAIPLPCDWKTFGLWLYRVENYFETRMGRKAAYDDDFTFTSNGDEMVASFEMPDTVGAP